MEDNNKKKAPFDGVGLASMIVSILGLVNGSLLMSVVGMIMGMVAPKNIETLKKSIYAKLGIAFGITGTVLSVIATILSIVFVVLYFMFILGITSLGSLSQIATYSQYMM